MPMESTCAPVGPMNTMIEFGGFKRKSAAFVLEQNSSFFAGPLDDLGILINGLGRDVMFRLAVEIAEADDLIEHMAWQRG